MLLPDTRAALVASLAAVAPIFATQLWLGDDLRMLGWSVLWLITGSPMIAQSWFRKADDPLRAGTIAALAAGLSYLWIASSMAWWAGAGAGLAGAALVIGAVFAGAAAFPLWAGGALLAAMQLRPEARSALQVSGTGLLLAGFLQVLTNATTFQAGGTVVAPLLLAGLLFMAAAIYVLRNGRSMPVADPQPGA